MRPRLLQARHPALPTRCLTRIGTQRFVIPADGRRASLSSSAGFQRFQGMCCGSGAVSATEPSKYKPQMRFVCLGRMRPGKTPAGRSSTAIPENARAATRTTAAGQPMRKYHATPLSGGDRKALNKEPRKASGMTIMLAREATELRAKGEALIQRPTICPARAGTSGCGASESRSTRRRQSTRPSTAASRGCRSSARAARRPATWTWLRSNTRRQHACTTWPAACAARSARRRASGRLRPCCRWHRERGIFWRNKARRCRAKKIRLASSG